MSWLVAGVAYVAGFVATVWLTRNVHAFRIVCEDDPYRMSVVWPFTWIAALCAALLIATSHLHEWLAGRRQDG